MCAQKPAQSTALNQTDTVYEVRITNKGTTEHNKSKKKDRLHKRQPGGFQQYIKKVNSDIQNTVRIRLMNIRGLLEIGLNEVAEMNQDSLHNI